MRLVILALLACLQPAAAQQRTEYRGFWVDTFNSALNNHADVAQIVSRAKTANANQIYAQVRRRGDAWYLDSLEPKPDGVPIEPGFDPLQDLIVEAHANAIEVHAFVIIGAVWNREAPPPDPNHVFNRHGVASADNWLTRTLLPNFSFDGHRFGAEFWIDLGHPAAAAYTLDVLMRLVRGYNIDGLHLDRIRYPELTASGQTPTNGANIGYNAVSVARFQKRYGVTTVPSPGDPLWAQWRRDQVTNFVRRLYLNAIAVRPDLKVSAALIAFGSGPTTEAAWTSAEAYWRVYQDWRAWMEEGILDIGIPMVYKRDHVATEKTWFDQWLAWTRTHQYNRAAIIGLGVYLNEIQGTVAQTQRSLPGTLGVNFYSMANPAVTGTFADFAAAIFPDRALIPQLPWKSVPRKGHLMGIAAGFDTAEVSIANAATGTVRSTATDGSGFFGSVDLDPGAYEILTSANGLTYAGRARVEPGRVTAVKLRAIDLSAFPPRSPRLRVE
jgi:uncharacterized lipoprotein YddW (UPF0748 family)